MSRVALLQMCSGIDPARNAKQLRDYAQQAREAGAQMLFTPEMTGLIDRDRNRSARNIKDEDHDVTLAAACLAAAEFGIWISLGSLAVRNPNTGKLRNRSFLIDDQGKTVARYDKMHLFDVDLPNGESWRESAAYEAGGEPVLAASPLGQIGLSICYDIRFPALYQAYSGAGASILNVPAAFTVPTGKDHWHGLLRARAIENACWVIAAAQCGEHEDGRMTFGHSLVIDPWGAVLLDMGEEIGLGFADLDLSFIEQARSRVPVLAHRKAIPDVSIIL
jgi:deaminated glutathione amidase